MAVAKSGRGWSLPASLRALEAEADRLAPKRSRASDGSIGDPAHRARKSDHNPSGRWVHAIDITHDPARGMDIHAHARNIAARRDNRIEYIISMGKIWERETGRWRSYDGDNPHNHHAHFSIKHTTTARYDVSPWLNGIVLFPTPTPKPPVYIPPTPVPIPPVVLPPIPAKPPITSVKDKKKMQLLRDHTGAIWLVGLDGSRHYISDMGEVEALKRLYEFIDLGPGSPFMNPIVTAVWLKHTFVR